MRGVEVIEHRIEVPLDHRHPDGETIEVFARELVKSTNRGRSLPRLLYLQGGPGGKAIRPVGNGGFLKRALDEYRVVLLDQRGTGRSTPLNRQTLARLGGPEAQAEYLTHFRADAIVRDAELLRHRINDQAPWSTLGQSYGGFITMTYLSFAPQGVAEAFVTGGLPMLQGTADDVYRYSYERVREKNEAYFARYPQDRETCRRIVTLLAESDVRLPTGERLSPRRFQGLGIGLGYRNGPEELHYLLEEAFLPGREGEKGNELSDTFLTGAQQMLSVATRPLYALFQEAIYCQRSASEWAAERLYQRRHDFAVDNLDFRFTGEMFYPFGYDEDPALVPLKEVAMILAEKQDWPRLYDPSRLARNQIPVYAAIYYDDMYVPREHSLRTAVSVGSLRPWITNAYEHDGLREGPEVLDTLIRMAKEGT